MTHEPAHPREWLPELALGVLPEAEADPVRAHLEGCAECQAEFVTMTRAAELLPLAAPAEVPGTGGRERLLARVKTEPRSGGKILAFRRRAAWGAVAAAAVLLLFVGVGGFWAGQQTGPDAELVDRQGAVVVAAATGELEVSRGGGGTARVALVRAPGEQAGFAFVEGLPELPAGRAYQAWFSRDGATFEPSSVFSSSDGGVWLTAGDAMRNYVALAFTIEDDGGAEQPPSDPFTVVPLNPSAASR